MHKLFNIALPPSLLFRTSSWRRPDFVNRPYFPAQSMDIAYIMDLSVPFNVLSPISTWIPYRQTCLSALLRVSSYVFEFYEDIAFSQCPGYLELRPFKMYLWTLLVAVVGKTIFHFLFHFQKGFPHLNNAYALDVVHITNGRVQKLPFAIYQKKCKLVRKLLPKVGRLN